MKAGRIVSLIIGSVLLMLFCIPLVSRILNLGNLVGILFGATLVSYGIFADKINASIKTLLKRREDSYNIFFTCLFIYGHTDLCDICIYVQILS